ncbi:MAG: hypothetical protein HY822_01500 [Acidobacteria bacterium]|nr:hypothetical protein [Acidobacteriota bacterium]
MVALLAILPAPPEVKPLEFCALSPAKSGPALTPAGPSPAPQAAPETGAREVPGPVAFTATLEDQAPAPKAEPVRPNVVPPRPQPTLERQEEKAPPPRETLQTPLVLRSAPPPEPQDAPPERKVAAAEQPARIEAPKADIRPARAPIDVSIRIAGAQDRTAEVRLTERGGELKVTVRAADPELAQTLRGGLDQLAERLETTGIKAHISQPAAAPAAAQSNSQPPNSGSSSGERSFDDSGSRGQNQQQQRNRNSGEWDDDLEAALSGRSRNKHKGA